MANLNTSVYHKSISHKGFSGKHKIINYRKGKYGCQSYPGTMP